MHGENIVQIGDESLSEASNMNFHKNANTGAEKFCINDFNQVGRIKILKQCIKKVQQKDQHKD